MADTSFSLVAAEIEDVPAIADISGASLDNDRHTEMKGLSEEPFDMKQHMLQSMPQMLQNPKVLSVKAVSESTGEIMGFCIWGFHGFLPNEKPKIDIPLKVVGRSKRSIPADNGLSGPAPISVPQSKQKVRGHADKVKELTALTDSDLQSWMREQMTEGSRCVYIINLIVAPQFQGRGIGRALLRFGTDFCDRVNCFGWVHSSQGAQKMYEKCGFHVVRTLDVDLDEYAPCPPPNEGPGAKWGPYSFYYMRYLPQ